jgi:hypothetical protein
MATITTTATGSATESTATVPSYAEATFNLSSALSAPTVVGLTVQTSGATTADYSNIEVAMGSSSSWMPVTGGTFVINAGHTSFKVRAKITNDTETELYESITFAVNQTTASVGLTDSWWVASTIKLVDAASSGSGSGSGSTTVVPVTLSAPATQSVAEGNAAIATYTINGTLGAAADVNVSVAGSGAVSGDDYSALYYRKGSHATNDWTSTGPGTSWTAVTTGKVSLVAGDTGFQLGVFLKTDSLTEYAEAVTFVASQDGIGNAIKDSWWVPSLVNITDTASGGSTSTPVPAVVMTTNNTTVQNVTEGSAAVATYSLSAALGAATMVNVSVTGSGAVSGDDYGDLYYRTTTDGTFGATDTLTATPDAAVWTKVTTGKVTLAGGTKGFQLGVFVKTDTLTEYAEAVTFVATQDSLGGGIKDSWWVQSVADLKDSGASTTTTNTFTSAAGPDVFVGTSGADVFVVSNGTSVFSQLQYDLPDRISLTAGDKIVVPGMTLVLGAGQVSYDTFTGNPNSIFAPGTNSLHVRYAYLGVVDNMLAVDTNGNGNFDALIDTFVYLTGVPEQTSATSPLAAFL